jgi:hypothetical protein
MARKLRVEYPGAIYHPPSSRDAGLRRDQRDESWRPAGANFQRALQGADGRRERRGAEHYGSERHETIQAHAEGVVVEELKRRGLGEEELGRSAKGDARKVAIAKRLRAETELTVKWIAERLQMGAPGHVHHLLYRQRKAQGK